MPRRCFDFIVPEKTPKKRSFNGLGKIDVEQGEILIDLSGKKWKLGKALASGGFGEIYKVIDFTDSRSRSSSYVVKLEPHSNGPLFAEVNCYLRIAKLEMIEDWKEKRDLDFLGMPHYIASGSHYHKNEKYRFLILPKYETDLEQILKETKIFNIKTVLTVSIQMLHVLEYIHSKGYVHCDIKASNIVIGKRHEEAPKKTFTRRPLRSNSVRKNTIKIRNNSRRNLRPLQVISYIDDIPYLEDMLDLSENRYNEITSDDSDFDQIYLLDFGLASKYLLSNGQHREFSPDERRAHAGTMLFCSRDAHKGMISRRSDLESLGYNIIYWLTGQLPWSDDLEQPEKIAEKKNKGFTKLDVFLKYCFNNNCPSFVLEYFKYIQTLEFTDCPDYDFCRKIFEEALDIYGLNKDLILDFNGEDDLKITKKKQKLSNRENELETFTFLMHSPLRPLSSNIIFKRPKLRKKAKNIKIQDSMMNWSKILMDPETIIKQARDKKNAEEEEAFDLSLLDIKSMNPTDNMLDIYNKSTGKIKNKVHRMQQNIDGYTPAMMKIYTKMMKGKRQHNRTKSKIHNHIVFRGSGKNNERREGRFRKRSESPITKYSR